MFRFDYVLTSSNHEQTVRIESDMFGPDYDFDTFKS